MRRQGLDKPSLAEVSKVVNEFLQFLFIFSVFLTEANDFPGFLSLDHYRKFADCMMDMSQNQQGHFRKCALPDADVCGTRDPQKESDDASSVSPADFMEDDICSVSNNNVVNFPQEEGCHFDFEGILKENFPDGMEQVVV